MKRRLSPYMKKVLLTVADLVAVCLSLPLALILRLDLEPAKPYLFNLWPKYYLVAMIAFGLVFYFFRAYRIILRLANLFTAMRVTVAVHVGAVVFYALSTFIVQLEPLPRSLFIIQIYLLVPMCLLIRFSLRLFERVPNSEQAMGTRTIVYGAGFTTDRFLPLLQKDPKYRIVGLVDDNAEKIGCEIQGVKVLGTGHSLDAMCQRKRVELLILAMPSLDGAKLREIMDQANRIKIKVKILPDPRQYFDNFQRRRVDLRDIRIEDLLRRPPRAIDRRPIESLVMGKSILVTGGGGSIGSELVRQIASMSPGRLVINDASELGLYSILEEVRSTYPKLNVKPHLGNLVDESVAENLFAKETFDSVFHACAYKHVPLVEENVCTAIKNNVISAWNVFEHASRSRVERVVLISSDKAVLPTNVMGATKRLCEMLALAYSSATVGSPMVFSAVRFGNVLGSSGSVVPKFLEQLNSGHPLTVTHPEMTRYFMLIPEAVSLVLQASTSNESGRVYILNMGKPVRILDLAQDLVRIAGRSGHHANIVFTGLRPGEKMHEELTLSEERVRVLSEDISYLECEQGKFPLGTLSTQITKLIKYCDFGADDAARALLFEIIGVSTAERAGQEKSSPQTLAGLTKDLV